MTNNQLPTASDYIRTLYEETRDGTLEIWYEGDTDEGYTETYSMVWSRADMEALVKEFETLRTQLDRIAAGDRSKELAQTHRTYVHPYDEPPFDKAELEEVLEKVEFAQPRSQEEQNLYEQYVQWRQAQAAARLETRGYHADALICRAQRYTRLMELEAPAIVIENEARCLAEELVLYRWAR